MEKKPKRTLVGHVNHQPDKYNPKVPCGARTRRGTLCKKPAMPGKQRCKFHGGASTGPKVPADQTGNLKAKKHGLYQKMLMPEELDWIEVMRAEEAGGSMCLIMAIEMLQVQFLRAAVAQKKWLAYRHRLDDATNDMIEQEMRRLGVLDRYELHHREGVKVVEAAGNSDRPEDYQIPYEDLKTVKRQTDYGDEMRLFSKAMDKNINTQINVQKQQMGEGDINRIAEDLQAFHLNAAAMMPGGDPDADTEPDN